MNLGSVELLYRYMEDMGEIKIRPEFMLRLLNFTEKYRIVR